MKRVTRYIVAAACVTVVAGLVWLMPAAPALAQASKIVLAEIVNTSEKPVPVAAQNTTYGQCGRHANRRDRELR